MAYQPILFKSRFEVKHVLITTPAPSCPAVAGTLEQRKAFQPQ
jgi:hypothetical protein